MLTRIINALISRCKYYLLPRQSLYVYRDYEHYRQTQIAGNLRKIDQVWAEEESIKFLSGYLKQTVTPLRFGICHGTRQGKEQQWFRNHLGIDVIGTEISPTAKDFPFTIQWDFHDVKPEWIDKTDFIFSNSLDHSYQPEKCLDTWMSCIRKGGVCILEWSSSNVEATELDPFGASLVGIKRLIQKKYLIKDVLKVPRHVPRDPTHPEPTFLVVTQRRAG